MKKTSLLWLMAVCLSAGYSCKKPELKPEPSAVSGSSLQSVVYDTDWPSVEGGMLVFRDGDHFTNYLNFLGNVTMFEDTTLTDDSMAHDINYILSAVESGIPGGFNSLRSQAYAAWQVLNETGWETVAEIPDIHFVNQIYIRSVLNNSLDVKIGPDIFHFINKDWCVKLPAGNATLFDDVHNLSEASTLNDITALAGADELTPFSLGSGNIAPTDMMKSTSTQFRISQPYIKVPEPCSNAKKIQLTGINMIELGTMTFNQGAYEINWGDGQTSYHTSNYSINNAYLDVEHTYSSFGTYTIKMRARAVYPSFTGGTYIAGKEFKIDVKNSACKYDYSKKSQKEWHYTPDAKRAWSGECEVFQGADWWGSAVNRIMATTERYEWKNGKWKNKRGDNPSIEIWCDIYDGNCNFQYQKVGHSYPGGASSASLNTGIGARFGWTKLVSRHRIQYNGQFYAFDLELKTCD